MTYEPGELRVVVYDDHGKACGQQALKTAGEPATLQLDVWTQQSPQLPLPFCGDTKAALHADGEDLAFITVSMVDADGTLVPTAQDQLTFEVSGAGSFEAICNGDATSLESFKKPTMRLFSGQLVVIVRSSKIPGTLKLKVTDRQRGLQQTVNIDCK